MSELQFFEQLRVIGTIMGYITAVLFLMWSVWAIVKLWLESMQHAARERAETYNEEYARAQRDRERLKHHEERKEYEKKYGTTYDPNFYR